MLYIKEGVELLHFFSQVKRKIVHVHVVNGHWLISSTLER